MGLNNLVDGDFDACVGLQLLERGGGRHELLLRVLHHVLQPLHLGILWLCENPTSAHPKKK